MASSVTYLRSLVFGQIEESQNMAEGEFEDVLENVLEAYSKEHSLSIKARRELKKELYNSIKKFDILEEALQDESVTEIMINGYDKIFIERGGIISDYGKTFESPERLSEIIDQIAAKSNRIVNESSPILDTRLDDGSRVNIVLSPISIDGSAVTIRKFFKNQLTLNDLIKSDCISRSMADFLINAVIEKKNIFISGGTGSGKTTFLNALSAYIPQNERIVTIEDSAELKIQVPNLVRLETRNKNVEGRNEIKIRELIRTALRMRPDRIIIGEIRGDEAIDLLQGLNTGHEGSLSTGHSNSAVDMLSRIETMFLMGLDMSLISIRSQIASAIDIIVHLRRYRNGKRRVEEIVEITGFDGANIHTEKLFYFDEHEACFKDEKNI